MQAGSGKRRQDLRRIHEWSIYSLGSIFVADLGLPKPKPRVGLFLPQAGHMGQWVLLWGQNLLGVTSVSFNGTAATTFASATVQGAWAKVPSGATSGPVTVTTANGTFTTKGSFAVE
jgi:hypothetical protein